MQLLRVVMARLVVGSALTLAGCGGGGGGGSTSAPPTDTTNPSVTISSPASGATVTGSITVSASASDAVGVTKVELYLDNALQSQDASAPYDFILNTASLAQGSHTLSAKAYDAAGNVGLSTVSITVPPADTVNPSVSINAPASGATVTGSITVSASASDNVAVAKVELYLDNVLQSQDASAPYSFSLDTASLVKGSHTLTAKAYDATGNVGESNVSVNVPIWTSIVPTITNSTATGTVILHGLASAAALGLDLHVDGLPAGTVIDSLTATGGAAEALAPTLDNVTGNISLAGATAFGSGPVIIIHFSGVPMSAVASDFRFSLVDVVGQDAQGNVHFIPLN